VYLTLIAREVHIARYKGRPIGRTAYARCYHLCLLTHAERWHFLADHELKLHTDTVGRLGEPLTPIKRELPVSANNHRRCSTTELNRQDAYSRWSVALDKARMTPVHLSPA
jgi:hypothetical protein